MDDEMEIWELEGELLQLQLFLLFDAQKQEQWSGKKNPLCFISKPKPGGKKSTYKVCNIGTCTSRNYLGVWER